MQTTLPANGLNLHVETFGDPKHPAVLLIMGLASSCLNWFPYFYEPIVQQGYYVIRFDNRDIGQSSWIEPSDWQTNPYTLEDMAQDSIGLLEALDISQAHILGVSMGGMIAQRIAISYPQYVLSLTSMLSAADSAALSFASIDLPAWDGSQLPPLAIQLQSWASLSGGGYPFDTQRYSDLYHEAFEVRRGYNPYCLEHHLTAMHRSGSRLKELRLIQAPTLVVHGREDPLIPESHAATYAQEIPDATYLHLAKVGHEIPAGVSKTVHTALFALFKT